MVDLCWQCMREAPYKCHCGHACCERDSVPSVRQGARADGALCIEHAAEQTQPVFENPTIWMYRPGVEPIEVEDVGKNIVQYMVRGYSQCPPPAEHT